MLRFVVVTCCNMLMLKSERYWLKLPPEDGNIMENHFLSRIVSAFLSIRLQTFKIFPVESRKEPNASARRRSNGRIRPACRFVGTRDLGHSRQRIAVTFGARSWSVFNKGMRRRSLLGSVIEDIMKQARDDERRQFFASVLQAPLHPVPEPEIDGTLRAMAKWHKGGTKEKEAEKANRPGSKSLSLMDAWSKQNEPGNSGALSWRC